MKTNTLLLRGFFGRLVSHVGVLVMAGGLAGGAVAQSERYQTLDDAAVAMAKDFQAGKKAKPIRSDDGKVLFAFGQSMPTLTCSPTRACDVEMQAGERINKVILGDKINWTWAQAESVEKGQQTQHVVIQPRDNTLETNAIITTDRRTYHIRLYAPKQEGVYLNRVGFYYPTELVEAWDNRAAAAIAVAKKEDSLRLTEESFDPENMDFDYRIDGSADFKPLRVYNTGKKVYLEMPKAVFESGEMPILLMIDEEGMANVVNYRQRPKRYQFMVDKLFTKAELRLGKEKVTITWGKKAGWNWGAVFGSGG